MLKPVVHLSCHILAGAVFLPNLMPLLSILFVMCTGKFERIAFSSSQFKLVMHSSFLWLSRFRLTASPN